MTASKNQKEKIVELTVLSIILILSFIFWDTYFVYPIKLSVVLMHEVSHAITTFLTGGKIISMNIGFDLGGYCQSEGGNAVLIASSGYLGSLIFGLMFFLSPNKIKIGKWIVISVCAIIVIVTVLTCSQIPFVLLTCFFFALMMVAAYYMGIPILAILIRAFGLISCVYVLLDIKQDLLEKHTAISDVSLLSSQTGISGIFYGMIWLTISIIILIFAFRISFRTK